LASVAKSTAIRCIPAPWCRRLGGRRLDTGLDTGRLNSGSVGRTAFERTGVSPDSRRREPAMFLLRPQEGACLNQFPHPASKPQCPFFLTCPSRRSSGG
jgi:hypothetical protein